MTEVFKETEARDELWGGSVGSSKIASKIAAGVIQTLKSTGSEVIPRRIRWLSNINPQTNIEKIEIPPIFKGKLPPINFK